MSNISAPNAGKLSNKYHPQKIAAIGMSITVFAFAILLFMDKIIPISMHYMCRCMHSSNYHVCSRLKLEKKISF